MASRQKKEQYKPFKKHLGIPLFLCGLIILAGIIMTLTDQTASGRLHIRRSWNSYWINAETITGPGAIGVGVLALAFILLIKVLGNKK